MSKSKSGNSAKYGRNKRAPSNSGQSMRTAKNKRLNIERAELRIAKIARRKAAKKVVRGWARYLRRQGKPRQGSAVIA